MALCRSTKEANISRTVHEAPISGLLGLLGIFAGHYWGRSFTPVDSIVEGTRRAGSGQMPHGPPAIMETCAPTRIYAFTGREG